MSEYFRYILNLMTTQLADWFCRLNQAGGLGLFCFSTLEKNEFIAATTTTKKEVLH